MKKAFVLAILLFSARDAAAQTPAGRFSISVNGGVQAAASDLHDTFTFVEFQENGTVTADYPAKAGLLVDGGFAVRLQKKIRAAVVVAYATRDSAAGIKAQIPHPFVLGRLRDISGTSSKLNRRELGAHAQLQYVMPLTSRVHLVLAGGPSYFNVEQQLVDTVQFDQVYPYDEATFRGATHRRAKGSGVGFNAGADAVWTFNRSVGLGGTVRFVRGSVDVKAADNRKVNVDAGGVQGGLGLRFFF